MSTQRERRLFEALYALAKAAEAVDEKMVRRELPFANSDQWRNLLSALVEANEALAYPTTADDHAPPGQAVP